jgi:hypothetical protein
MWTRHVVRMGKWERRTNLVGKAKGKRPLMRRRCRYDDDRWWWWWHDVKEKGLEDATCILFVFHICWFLNANTYIFLPSLAVITPCTMYYLYWWRCIWSYIICLLRGWDRTALWSMVGTHITCTNNIALSGELHDIRRYLNTAVCIRFLKPIGLCVIATRNRACVVLSNKQMALLQRKARCNYMQNWYKWSSYFST